MSVARTYPRNLVYGGDRMDKRWRLFESRNGISVSDIYYYVDILSGKIGYDIDDIRVMKIETLILCWLEERPLPEKHKGMSLLFEEGIKNYCYSLGAYRGIHLNENQKLKFGYLASFSSDCAVALKFSKFDKNINNNKNYIFICNEPMFDLHAMLHDILKITCNEKLIHAVKNNIDEFEKIGYFDENCVDVSAEFGLRG